MSWFSRRQIDTCRTNEMQYATLSVGSPLFTNSYMNNFMLMLIVNNTQTQWLCRLFSFESRKNVSVIWQVVIVRIIVLTSSSSFGYRLTDMGTMQWLQKLFADFCSVFRPKRKIVDAQNFPDGGISEHVMNHKCQRNPVQMPMSSLPYCLSIQWTTTICNDGVRTIWWRQRSSFLRQNQFFYLP